MDRTMNRIKKLTIDDERMKKMEEVQEKKKLQLTLPKLPKLEMQKKLEQLYH